jgi:hypothetical protein
MKPGFFPWYLSHDEAKLTIDALQNFCMAFISYVSNNLDVDFESGETLLRFCDTESGQWYNTALEMPSPPFIVPKMVITDELLIARLKKKKKTRAKLGFAVTYVPMPIQERKSDRPRVPRMAVLLDLNIGKPIGHATDEDRESIGEATVQMLTDYIENNGRPASIAVADEDSGNYIEDFATKLGIKLTEDGRLSLLGSMLFGMMDMMESGQFDL